MPVNNIKKLVLLLLLIWLAACDTPIGSTGASEQQTWRHSIFRFGTIIDVSIYGVDETSAQTLFDQLEQDFEYMHTTWHPWQKSALARNNQLLTYQEWFSDAPSVRPLMVQAKQYAEMSDQLFNPAIGKLIKLWGFTQGKHETGLPPDADAITRLVESNPSMNDVEIKGVRMRGHNPDLLVDFGGFGKGYGIGRAMDMLRSQGVENAIINAGGDLVAIGRHGDRPWRIGIRHPRNADKVLAYIDVSGQQSVFSSGDYERFFIHDGRRYHHIIDPRTGYPATGTQAVTVMHPDPALADAAATALFVAGPSEWRHIAQKMGIQHVMLVDSDGRIHLSPAMNEVINFQQRDTLDIVISEPISGNR